MQYDYALNNVPEIFNIYTYRIQNVNGLKNLAIKSVN
jgi:hypothetical protein